MECMPNICGKDDDLRVFSAKVEAAYTAEASAEGSTPNIVHICKGMLAANEGQNRFGEVAGPFMAFSDYNDFR